MTPNERRRIESLIAEYDRQAVLFEQESIGLRARRNRRLEQVDGEAGRRAEVTPYVIADPASVAASWAGTDPKLNEYNAGLAIVERRATMYAQMSANLKMTLLLDAFAQGINVTGSLAPAPARVS